VRTVCEKDGLRSQTRLDSFAFAARDPSFSYESVLKFYRRIEDWRGAPDPHYRGVDGPCS
jgi:hypothetical protein